MTKLNALLKRFRETAIEAGRTRAKIVSCEGEILSLDDRISDLAELPLKIDEYRKARDKRKIVRNEMHTEMAHAASLDAELAALKVEIDAELAAYEVE